MANSLEYRKRDKTQLEMDLKDHPYSNDIMDDNGKAVTPFHWLSIRQLYDLIEEFRQAHGSTEGIPGMKRSVRNMVKEKWAETMAQGALPDGWGIGMSNGKVFFRDKKMKKTYWTDPRQPAAQKLTNDAPGKRQASDKSDYGDHSSVAPIPATTITSTKPLPSDGTNVIRGGDDRGARSRSCELDADVARNLQEKDDEELARYMQDEEYNVDDRLYIGKDEEDQSNNVYRSDDESSGEYEETAENLEYDGYSSGVSCFSDDESDEDDEDVWDDSKGKERDIEVKSEDAKAKTINPGNDIRDIDPAVSSAKEWLRLPLDEELRLDGSRDSLTADRKYTMITTDAGIRCFDGEFAGIIHGIFDEAARLPFTANFSDRLETPMTREIHRWLRHHNPDRESVIHLCLRHVSREVKDLFGRPGWSKSKILALPDEEDDDVGVYLLIVSGNAVLEPYVGQALRTMKCGAGGFKARWRDHRGELEKPTKKGDQAVHKSARQSGRRLDARALARFPPIALPEDSVRFGALMILMESAFIIYLDAYGLDSISRPSSSAFALVKRLQRASSLLGHWSDIWTAPGLNRVLPLRDSMVGDRWTKTEINIALIAPYPWVAKENLEAKGFKRSFNAIVLKLLVVRRRQNEKDGIIQMKKPSNSSGRKGLIIHRGSKSWSAEDTALLRANGAKPSLDMVLTLFDAGIRKSVVDIHLKWKSEGLHRYTKWTRVTHWMIKWRRPWFKIPWNCFMCPFNSCSKVFRDSGCLKRHLARHHPSGGQCKCQFDQCDEVFESTDALATHVDTAHTDIADQRYQCEEPGCGKSFVSINTRHIHYNNFHREGYCEPVSCPIEGCDKIYKNLCQLQMHVSCEHRKEIPDIHECEIEGCSFRSEKWGDLKQHIDLRHTKTKGAIARDNERPLKCSEPNCEKAYKTKSGLKTHIMDKHSGAGRFPCQILGCTNKTAFSNEANLIAHIKKCHKEESFDDKEEAGPFPCPHQSCRSVTKTRKGLDRHISQVHPEMSFPCQEPQCGQTYRTTLGLIRHVHSIHSEKRQRDDSQIAEDKAEEPVTKKAKKPAKPKDKKR